MNQMNQGKSSCSLGPQKHAVLRCSQRTGDIGKSHSLRQVAYPFSAALLGGVQCLFNTPFMADIRFYVILLIGALILSGPAKTGLAQDTIKVAVATNFIRTADKLADRFAKETDITVIRSSGATGMLYSQIVNGAPYDLFLAADEIRPELLHQQGLCEEPFTYAGGRVVLWSSRKDLDESENWQKTIVRQDIVRVAIANPETAPYGAAAKAAMQHAGISEIMKPRLVYGQNVGQAFQYGRQGAADMAFVSLSIALSEQGRQGKTWLLPETLAVVQKGCLLAGSKNKESVHDLIAFLRTGRARIILTESGYN